MIFPIRTDRPLRHTPYVNYGLIIANILIFLLQIGQPPAGPQQAPWYFWYMLHPVEPAWYQFFTYQFLHGGLAHIAFNMLFLFVFGQNLEDRFGSWGYLAFYLTGGVIAGIGHALVESSPVLGASGSVSAVTGAYLALFPLTRVTVIWFLFIITFFQIPSMYLILFSFGWDLLQFILGAGGVAYLAHLSGNVFGFGVGMALLGVRILPREPYDLLALLNRWNRRRAFRASVRGGSSPWHADTGRRLGAERPFDEHEQRTLEARSTIARALSDHDADRALETYEKLLRDDPEQVMHREGQLDLANHAMHAGRYETAAHAYELFLRRYRGDEFSDQVHLILGLIYGRYLRDAGRARPHLSAAAEKLSDPDRRQMAADLLAELD